VHLQQLLVLRLEQQAAVDVDRTWRLPRQLVLECLDSSASTMAAPIGHQMWTVRL
jgi:hypothetical protein